MTLEEKGAYSLLLDLMYVRGGPVPDEPRYIAGVCNCSVRKWNSIRARLIELGKVEIVDGFLTNHRAEKEIENALKTSRKLAENGAKGGEKRAENERDIKKNKGIAQAGLKHTRASLQLNSINKGFAKKSGLISDGAVRLDRYADELLFKACERLTGREVPSYMQHEAFPPEIVEQAKKELAH